MGTPLLSVQDLTLELPRPGGWTPILTGVDFALEAGSIVGLVGESGAGKTLTALTMLGLLPPIGLRLSGRIDLEGQDLLALTDPQMRRLRGKRLAMIFQEPMTALNPVLTIGQQIQEAVAEHRPMGRRAARSETIRLLERVAMPAAAKRLTLYPHQLSGGQRQRVLIAMALAGAPDLLIADEPTTALDPTVQAQILDLLEQLNRDLGLTILLITHDLAVVAESCHRVLVLDCGRIVERADVGSLFRQPQQPLTQRLVALSRASRPVVGGREADPSAAVGERAGDGLIEIRNLSKHYAPGGGRLRRGNGRVLALDRITLSLGRGECIALVGESGAGKTTLGMCMLGLTASSEGEVLFEGGDLSALGANELRRRRRDLQVVFQDSGAALDARLPVSRSIAEPLEVHGDLDATAIQRRVTELLDWVELPKECRERFPHELSAGQKQRVGIARALATRPQVLVADEPVAALDLVARAHILDLLVKMRRDLGTALLLITHDLHAVARVADSVAVLYCGRVVELAPAARWLVDPQHPYSVALLAARLSGDPTRRRLDCLMMGEPPDPADLPVGCRFHPRCPIAEPLCREVVPDLLDGAVKGHRVACHYPGTLAPGIGGR